MKPIVVVAGIMDTKGKELLYIRDRVRVMGCDTLMIELMCTLAICYAALIRLHRIFSR